MRWRWPPAVPPLIVMRIDPAGWPFIVGSAVVGLVGGLMGGGAWAVPGLLGVATCVFFFRDPERVIAAAADSILSPADGKVMIAGPPVGTSVPAGRWQQVSIFLSPLDVHVNRIPLSGRVTHVEYHPGKFLPAYRTEAGDLNEYTEIHIEHGASLIVVRQIVGVLARRIVCRARQGAEVRAGDRYGVMKFGSRMDLFIPVGAALHVQPGDRVVAGITVLADLAKGGAQS